jgi:hypothetical protein
MGPAGLAVNGQIYALSFSIGVTAFFFWQRKKNYYIR